MNKIRATIAAFFAVIATTFAATGDIPYAQQNTNGQNVFNVLNGTGFPYINSPGATLTVRTDVLTNGGSYGINITNGSVPVSVMAYGAKGGTNDDTSAFSNDIASNSDIYVPATGGEMAGSATLTTTTNFTNGQTVSVGLDTYIFTNTISVTQNPAYSYRVLIGSNAAASLYNLASSMNLWGGEGYLYGWPTHILKCGKASISGTNAMTVTAIYNGTWSKYISLASSTNAAWSSTNLIGGVDSYSISHMIPIPSHRHIIFASGVAISRITNTLSESESIFFENSDQTNGNTGITLEGLGDGVALDCNGIYQLRNDANGWCGMGYRFSRVRGITIKGVHIINPLNFAHFFAECNNVQVVDCSVHENWSDSNNTILNGGLHLNSDGLHFDGCNDVSVDGFWGYSQNDDFIAINPYDGPTNPAVLYTNSVGGNGTAFNYVLSRIKGDTGGGFSCNELGYFVIPGFPAAVRLLATSTNTISNVTFKDCSDTTFYAANFLGSGSNSIINSLKFIRCDFSRLITPPSEYGRTIGMLLAANTGDITFDQCTMFRQDPQNDGHSGTDTLIVSVGAYTNSTIRIENSVFNFASVYDGWGSSISSDVCIQNSYLKGSSIHQSAPICLDSGGTGHPGIGRLTLTGNIFKGFNSWIEAQNGYITNMSCSGNSFISPVYDFAYYNNYAVLNAVFSGNSFIGIPTFYTIGGTQALPIRTSSGGNDWRGVTNYISGGTLTNSFNGIDYPISTATLTPLSNDVVIDPTNGYSRYNGSAWTNR